MARKYMFKAVSPDNLKVTEFEIEIPNNVKESARDQSLPARKKIIKGIAGVIAALMKSPYRYILAGILVICFIVAIAVNFTTIKNFAKENVHAIVASVKSWSVKSKADSYLESLCESAIDDKSPDARLNAIKALGSAGGTEDFVLEALKEAAIGDYYYLSETTRDYYESGWIFKDRKYYSNTSKSFKDGNAVKAVEILIGKGKSALEYISDVAVQAYSENVRIKAIQALGEMGGTEDFVLEALSEAAIGDPSLDKDFDNNDNDFPTEYDVKVKNNVDNAVEAVKILKEKGKPALEYLKKVAKKSNYDSARSFAVLAIGEIVGEKEKKAQEEKRLAEEKANLEAEKKKKEEEFKKYYDLADEALGNKFYQEAVENFDKALVIYPNNHNAFLGRQCAVSRVVNSADYSDCNKLFISKLKSRRKEASATPP